MGNISKIRVDGVQYAIVDAALVDQVETLAEEVAGIRADLDYVAIEITSISNNAGTVELGTTIPVVTVSWQTNKEPTSQTVEGETVAADAGSANFENVTASKTYTVTVTDERGATDTGTTAVAFYNGVYCGAVLDGAALDSAAIQKLTKRLQAGRGLTFQTIAGTGQRIAYALPTRYGKPSFNVGGFDGGFTLAATIDYTNESQYTEQYDVWLSDNTGLGQTTVKVT